MELLYSDILPLGTEENQQTIIDCFHKQFEQSDEVNIAVGYTSLASINELKDLVDKYQIKHICLTIGMYYTEGMPENAYHTALRLNQTWKNAGIGEIRIVKPFRYHGKLYCFYKNGNPFSAVIGSANLGVIKPEAANRRQYEIAAFTSDEKEAADISAHIEKLNSDICSENIADVKDMPLVREKNTALDGIELVSKVPQSNVDFYKRCTAYISFILKLKVPHFNERFMDDGKHFTKSNINVCYAAPRSRQKPRDWYETQLTVNKEIYKMEGYPQKNHPFFVVTDDGYWFKAHTTSDNNKQFSAVGDELIMGRWLKGRLEAAGIVRHVNNTAEDKDRVGMITAEMLKEYGCDSLLFKKTGQSALDENGNELDVWLLSFTDNSANEDQR